LIRTSNVPYSTATAPRSWAAAPVSPAQAAPVQLPVHAMAAEAAALVRGESVPVHERAYDSIAGLLAQLHAAVEEWFDPEPKPRPRPQPKPEPNPRPAPQPGPAPRPAPPRGVDAAGARAQQTPKAWFISQYRGAYNSREDAAGNGNCGPTSVAMLAKAFGKIDPGAAGADAAIEDARRRVGESRSEYKGTSVAGLARGLESYGLDAKTMWSVNIPKLKAELAKGRLLICHVIPSYLNPNTRSTGHYTTVYAIRDGKVYLNDPARTAGPVVVSERAFMEGVRRRGTYAAISVGS